MMRIVFSVSKQHIHTQAKHLRHFLYTEDLRASDSTLLGSCAQRTLLRRNRQILELVL